MAGYCGFSKSNNAIDAEDSGLMTATQVIKWLNKFGFRGLTAKILDENVTADEWHHTSSHYNATNYYNPIRIYENRHILKNKAKEAKKTKPIVNNLEVRFVEWEGTRKHPVAKERTFTGEIIFKGAFAFFDGKKKKINGNYIEFYKDGRRFYPN